MMVIEGLPAPFNLPWDGLLGLLFSARKPRGSFALALKSHPISNAPRTAGA